MEDEELGRKGSGSAGRSKLSKVKKDARDNSDKGEGRTHNENLTM